MDFHYENMSQFQKVVLALDGLQSEACKNAKTRFEFNMNRATMVLHLPATTFMWGHHTTKEGSIDLRNNCIQDGSQIKGYAPKSIDLHLLTAPDWIKQQFRALYVSILNQSWSAFESMCGDLWEDVVNEHPTFLATLSGRTSGLPRDKGGSDEDDSLKTLSLGILARENYNVSGRMGTILRNEKSLSFSKLSGIRKAYRLAFGDKAPKVHEILSNGHLDAIAAVRNLQVHRCGIADDEFMSKKKFFTEPFGLSDGAKGLILFVDAKFLWHTLDILSNSAAELIFTVDDWLKKNPNRESD